MFVNIKKYQKISVELDNLSGRSDTGQEHDSAGTEQSSVDQKNSYRKLCLVAIIVVLLTGCGLALATAVFSTDESKGRVRN